jgi:hypothetical protein
MAGVKCFAAKQENMSLLNDTSVSFLAASTSSLSVQHASIVSMTPPTASSSSGVIALSCTPQGALQLAGAKLVAPGNYLLLTVNGTHFKMLLEPDV